MGRSQNKSSSFGFSRFHFRVYRKFYISSVAPVVVGVCLGITIHMLIMEMGCNSKDNGLTAEEITQRSLNIKTVKKIRKRSVDATIPEDENLDFVARIINLSTLNISVNLNVTRKKFYRPHTIKDELHWKEKLFVAVLTSPSTIEKLGVAFEKTTARHFPEVIFFSSGKIKSELKGLKIVAFEDTNPEMLPILVLTYIKKNLPEAYDFYLFVTDRTYLRAQKYHDFLKYMSITEDVYSGNLAQDGDFCTLHSGILISYSIISKVLSELTWCSVNNKQGNPGKRFAQCIHHASNKFCTPWKNGHKMKAFKLDNFDFDLDILHLKSDHSFNQSLTFYPMLDDVSFYKIHRYFCTKDLTEVQSQIDAAKANIIDLSQHSPGGRDSLSWPLGTKPSTQVDNRFSIIPWVYFTEKDMFLDDEVTNVKDLSGADIPDILDIKREIAENLNKKYPSRFTLETIVNGYRRFDPNRGMEYTIDILLLDKTKNNGKVFKRVHLVRPIGNVELVPTPFVTENIPLHIILPLQPTNVDSLEKFLVSYAHSCLVTKQDVYLIVALLYPAAKATKDPFEKAKKVIDDTNKKYNSKEKLYWKALENAVTDINIMDKLQTEFKSDVLILLTTVNSEMSPNFTSQYLNRVRMNTVKENQVYFPMGFWQYRPNLLYDKKPFPASVEIGQKLGIYNKKATDNAGFYLSDYKTARNAMKSIPSDIFTMFITYKKFHVFQAVEPNLKFKWMYITCDSRMQKMQFEECKIRNLDGLGSQHHLAKLIYEYRNGNLSKPDSGKPTPKPKAQNANTPKQNKSQTSKPGAKKPVTPKPKQTPAANLHQPFAPFMVNPRRVPAPKYKLKDPELKLHHVNFDMSEDDPLGEDMLLVDPKKPIRV
ncbi:chondroitin sulfate glucuronyltransferase-like [Ruditapes philippinarum]|uniref:chondroitin sulfate glucuronyltransferase-like n=1 Tax=Ruditapes philippinarum TaxID=129788 RepID=UPI00295A7473|nr:chondroitin sulfate glucuronyltransferase-like [Ruditapes philippinarum]